MCIERGSQECMLELDSLAQAEYILCKYRSSASAYVRKPANSPERSGSRHVLTAHERARTGLRVIFVSSSLQRSEPETGGPEAAPGPGQANTTPTDSGEQKVRILILEDDAWDAELAQRLLADAGIEFTAIVVATEAAFVEQLTAFRPDIILSDFSLPDFSGEIALKIARDQCPGVPFIIWSGALGDEAAVKLIKQGATDYLLKDRPARLPSAILRALAEVDERARLAQLEGQLTDAQRLASLGQLSAAQEAVSLTRQMLAAARQEIAATSASGSTGVSSC
jgi:CheY-like chemotaxis protein